jgi:hypothetical protein
LHCPKEYYTWNVKDLDEPLNFSTIYWNYQVELDNKKATTLKFYTGDVAGDFKIIVQGVTENGVVYGEKEFKVLK